MNEKNNHNWSESESDPIEDVARAIEADRRNKIEAKIATEKITNLFTEISIKLLKKIPITGTELEIDYRTKSFYIGVIQNKKLIKHLRKRDPFEFLLNVSPEKIKKNIIDYFVVITKSW